MGPSSNRKIAEWHSADLGAVPSGSTNYYGNDKFCASIAILQNI